MVYGILEWTMTKNNYSKKLPRYILGSFFVEMFFKLFYLHRDPVALIRIAVFIVYGRVKGINSRAGIGCP